MYNLLSILAGIAAWVLSFSCYPYSSLKKALWKAKLHEQLIAKDNRIFYNFEICWSEIHEIWFADLANVRQNWDVEKNQIDFTVRLETLKHFEDSKKSWFLDYQLIIQEEGK